MQTHDLQSMDTGTAMDQVSTSQPDTKFDAAFAGNFFSGVRSEQPEIDTYCATDGIDSISVALWGMGTRSVDVNVSGKGVADQTCPKGMCSILPAGIDCSFILRPTDGYNFSFFIDPRKFAQTFEDDHPAGKVLAVRTDLFGQDETLLHLASEYIREFEEAQAYSAIALETIAMQVSLHLARRYGALEDKPYSLSGALAENLRMERVKDFIDAHLDAPLRLSDLAAVACLSQYHFSRCFKACVGISPHQYVVKQRLEKAGLLLGHSAMTIAEIANECGFSSQQHMTDQFRKAYGQTPGRVRQDVKHR